MKDLVKISLVFVFVLSNAFGYCGNIAFDEKVAEFPGGQQALAKYIRSSLSDYSNFCRETFLGGKCILKFIVGTKGIVDSVEILKSTQINALDSIAKVIILNMPKWSPAKLDGNNVRCYFNLPINFSSSEFPVFIFSGNLKDSYFLESKKLILQQKYFEAFEILEKQDQKADEILYLQAVTQVVLKKKKKAKKYFERVVEIRSNSEYYQLSKSYLEKLY